MHARVHEFPAQNVLVASMSLKHFAPPVWLQNGNEVVESQNGSSSQLFCEVFQD